ncbi:copper chaperone [Streptomyces sp. AJS327]|uniref:heavy-metal-associated domain-containing protein n=1 Tax=Streptomyces sp. AJS327 TaxID=2545265 RepID=UPI0015DE8F73|nr:heavy-metal-associated domain-containing protein [Streptomyces sp. AJS327]MBA0050577.1 copper chaperone [Streptomyces sp. AJS327]
MPDTTTETAQSTSCCTTDGSCHGEPVAEQPVTTVFHVSGMSCGRCRATLTRAIGALDGVSEVRVDLSAQQVAVTTAGEPDDALIARAVSEVGYGVVGRV